MMTAHPGSTPELTTAASDRRVKLGATAVLIVVALYTIVRSMRGHPPEMDSWLLMGGLVISIVSATIGSRTMKSVVAAVGLCLVLAAAYGIFTHTF
ncbi:MAG TPA: hypothetical protein VN706_12465 [Gemmatimonadaceae bacterium]|nr:hypothetical protein [Gemmatimonadaceae bacterium]